MMHSVKRAERDLSERPRVKRVALLPGKAEELTCTAWSEARSSFKERPYPPASLAFFAGSR